jgi:hypothetical protein
MRMIVVGDGSFIPASFVKLPMRALASLSCRPKWVSQKSWVGGSICLAEKTFSTLFAFASATLRTLSASIKSDGEIPEAISAKHYPFIQEGDGIAYVGGVGIMVNKSFF